MALASDAGDAAGFRSRPQAGRGGHRGRHQEGSCRSPVPRRCSRRFRCPACRAIAFFLCRLSLREGRPAPDAARRTQGRARHARLSFRIPPPARRGSSCGDGRGAGRQTGGVFCRELTKTFEEARRGQPRRSCPAHYAEADTPRARSSSCVGPPLAVEQASAEDTDRLLLFGVAAEMGASRAAGEAARMTGTERRPISYRRADGAQGRCRLMPLTGAAVAQWQGPSQANGSPRFALRDQGLPGNPRPPLPHQTRRNRPDRQAWRRSSPFVEVKARPTLIEGAMDAVTPARPAPHRGGRRSGGFARRPDHGQLPIRYDLVAVLPRRWPVHVEGTFFQGRR